jgi:hypothetical protein
MDVIFVNLKDFSSVPILPFDAEAIEVFDQLRSQKVRVATMQYGSLRNTIKTKEINKGCSLSGVEWDTHEINEFIGLGFDSAHPTHFGDFLIV